MRKKNITSLIFLMLCFLYTDSYTQEDKGIIYGTVKDVIKFTEKPDLEKAKNLL